MRYGWRDNEDEHRREGQRDYERHGSYTGTTVAGLTEMGLTQRVVTMNAEGKNESRKRPKNTGGISSTLSVSEKKELWEDQRQAACEAEQAEQEPGG